MLTSLQTRNHGERSVSRSPARLQIVAPRPNGRERPLLDVGCSITNQSGESIVQTDTEDLKADSIRAQSRGFWHDFSQIRVHSPFSGTIQTQLKINQPRDEYEREAEKVSERVVQMSGSRGLGTGVSSGRIWECQAESPVQKQVETSKTQGISLSHSERIAVPPTVDEVLSSSGQPLDSATRAFMEPRFGHNFAKVRIHTDERARESAKAVSARAYVVGNHMVFGEDQHKPGTLSGQRLLAHELTHVVQQNGGLRSEVAVGNNISQAPKGSLYRDPLTTKDEALKKHEEAQTIVAGLLDKARKITPDPKKDYRDPDMLFRNTVGLLDGGKLTLTVLSPTHVSPDLHFDSRVKFDSQHSPIKGDYPAAPKDGFEGVVADATSAMGKVNVSQPPSLPSIQTLPPKEEHIPGETKPAPKEPKPSSPVPIRASAPFAPGDVFFFTRGLDISEAQFRNTFVHEGQHVADLSPKAPKMSTTNDVLESYKSEFRAFWIQPPIPRTSELATESINRLPEPSGTVDNSTKVSISKPEDCKICTPPNASAPAEVTTHLKNPRQAAIFWHLLSNYPTQQYDCCYVYDKKFRDAVDNFSFPGSINLINSDRLMNLNLEIQKLSPSMTRTEVSGTNLLALLNSLDHFDWAFLNDTTLSDPFWHALKDSAPAFVFKGAKALAGKAIKNPISEADVKKALLGK